MAFLPVFPVLYICYRWQVEPGKALYALGRMLIQLLLIGYCLNFIFAADRSWVIILVLAVMLFASSWISLTSLEAQRRLLYRQALAAIGLAGGVNLFVIAVGVLELEPWYSPRYLVPLAGMIFANAMNTVSLAAERMAAELAAGHAYDKARAVAFRASLIPLLNSLLAVGLVSLPGMMTGQILSGVSPLIAARYQIMVMAMMLGAAGGASALFLLFSRAAYLGWRSTTAEARE
nr:ABC transporter permease [Motiliproteus sp. SC1-56]